MANKHIKILVIALLTPLLLQACIFKKIKEDNERFADTFQHIQGEVSVTEEAPGKVLLVFSKDKQGENIRAIRTESKPGLKPEPFKLLANNEDAYLFAFQDLNDDTSFQTNEPSALTKISRNHAATIKLTLKKNNSDTPLKLINQDLYEAIRFNSGTSYQVGTLTTLDNDVFSPEIVNRGLWEPLSVMQEGVVGLYFLNDYDPKKIPVLFVHGINGSPTNFKDLIANLDQDKYQPWVYYYPSGFRLDLVANGLFSFMAAIDNEYDIPKMHLVAHSMGGLVTRGYLNICTQQHSCDYLASYTTISTPWGGHRASEFGTKAPAVVPVWNDMAPSSDYLATLFNSPRPNDIPHYLLFSYKGDGKADDGVVSIESMLRDEAQSSASFRRGYNEDHMSILSAPAVIEKLNNILSSH
jgi:uncharacterized alpha/beta hydrolase family protein